MNKYSFYIITSFFYAIHFSASENGCSIPPALKIDHGPLISVNRKGNFIYLPTTEQLEQGVMSIVYIPFPQEKMIIYYTFDVSQEIFANGKGIIYYPDGKKKHY